MAVIFLLKAAEPENPCKQFPSPKLSKTRESENPCKAKFATTYPENPCKTEKQKRLSRKCLEKPLLETRVSRGFQSIIPCNETQIRMKLGVKTEGIKNEIITCFVPGQISREQSDIY